MSIDHLERLNETYWEHWKVAMRIAFAGLSIFLIGIIHAFLPFLFKDTVGWIVIDWFYQIRGRRHGRFDMLRCRECGSVLTEHLNRSPGRVEEVGNHESRQSIIVE